VAVPKRWTTTCAARVLHRLFDRHHARHGCDRAQRTTVGSHERIGASACSAATGWLHRALHRLCHLGGCCIPEYKVSLPKLIEILVNDKKHNPSNYSLVILSEGAEWEGLPGQGVRRGGRFRASQEDERGRRPVDRNQVGHRRGDHRQRPDLRLALRQPGFRRPPGGEHVRRHGDGRHRGRQERTDGAISGGASPWCRFPIPSWVRGMSKSKPCTTPSASGRSTITSRIAHLPHQGLRLELEASVFAAECAAYRRAARPHPRLVRPGRRR